MDNASARRLIRNGAAKPNELELYRRQLDAFHNQFGREMEPDDPFFFDPTASKPQFRSAEHADEAIELLAELMAEANVDPAAIFAFRKTRGLFPTLTERFSRAEMAEWDAAIQEYHAGPRR